MMMTEKFWLIFWLIVGICIMGTSAILSYSSYRHTQLFVDNNYVDCPVLGSRGTHWCKYEKN